MRPQDAIRRRSLHGFTLVELLVVIGIIGILVALLLPAVQSARESARRADCSNNVKQLSLGLLGHESAMGRFPTSGWGWAWMPEPNRGTGIPQPGSWFYCVLPYIEQQPLYELGHGGNAQEVADANRTRNLTVISIFNCPSRRKNQLYPNYHSYNNCTFADRASRGDYAVNGGDQPDCEYVPGPKDLASGDNGTFLWLSNRKMTGIAYLRSEVRMSHILDGTSATYLVGERYLNPNNYETGNDLADNSSMFSGFENETVRTTYSPPKPDTPGVDYIVQGSIGASTCAFGSAHPTVFQTSFVDGSVRSISYAIDPVIHRHLGNRQDGEVIDATKF